MLNGPVANRLEQIIHEVVDEHGWKIVQLAIQNDHVHLFIRTDPYTLPTDIARLIKGRSSHHMRKEFPHLAQNAQPVDAISILFDSRQCEQRNNTEIY